MSAQRARVRKATVADMLASIPAKDRAPDDQAQTYSVFVRTWWKRNPLWPDGLEPCAGPKRYIERGVSEAEARAACAEYAAAHPPGVLSEKAEYEAD